MGFSEHDFQKFVSRGLVASKAASDAVTKEVGHGGLHDAIERWCNDQWPKVKYVHSRTDQSSSTANGVPDFILFLNGGRVLCVECKTRTGKLTPEQAAWSFEMTRLGHTVHIVRSMREFLELVDGRKGTI